MKQKVVRHTPQCLKQDKCTCAIEEKKKEKEKVPRGRCITG